MQTLTPSKLVLLNIAVESFMKTLESQNIRLLELDEQYKLVLQNVEAAQWSCSAIKTLCHSTKESMPPFIDVYEIYINIGYGCYICVYMDEEFIDLPTNGWSDLPRLGQNSFIGTHLDYYAESNHFEIVKREE